MSIEEYKKALDFVSDEKIKLLKENELLKEELKSLKDDITRLYNTMICGEQVTKVELSNEYIEEI